MAGIPHHAAERYCAELIPQRPQCGSLRPIGNGTRQGQRQGHLAQTGHHPRAHTGHRAGRGHAQRPPQQLACSTGDRTAALPLRGGSPACEHWRTGVAATGEQRRFASGVGTAGSRRTGLGPGPELTAPGNNTDRPAWCPERLQLTAMASTPSAVRSRASVAEPLPTEHPRRTRCRTIPWPYAPLEVCSPTCKTPGP